MNVTVARAVLDRVYEGSHSPVWQRLRLRCGLMTLGRRGVQYHMWEHRGPWGEKRPVDDLD